MQGVPYRISPRRSTSRHTLIKLTENKHKERVLKLSREEKQVTHKGKLIRLPVDLSAETLQAKKERQDIFKVLKDKTLPSRLLYSAKISFKIDGEIKSFTDKQKFREFSTTKSNTKRTLIARKHKRKERCTKTNQKQSDSSRKKGRKSNQQN